MGELLGRVRGEIGRLEIDVEGHLREALAGELGGKQGAELVRGGSRDFREGFEDHLMVGLPPRVAGKTAQDASAMHAGRVRLAKELEELELLLDAVRVLRERHRQPPDGILPFRGKGAKK